MAVDEPTEPFGERAVARAENVDRRLFRLFLFGALRKDRRMCFDRGDDGDVARLDTF